MAETLVQVTFNGGQDNAALKASLASVDPAAITALQAVEQAVEADRAEVATNKDTVVSTASQVATDAQTASSAATQAGDSASAAAGSASQADLAKQGAQTAETGAVAAKDAAQTAKVDTLAIYGTTLDMQAAVDSANASEIAAGNSEVAAGESAAEAQSWATSLTLVDGTYYGARKYAEDASGSATAADGSAITAGNHATAAGSAKTAAESAKTTAQNASSTAQQAATDAGTHRDAALQIKQDMDALILSKSQEFDAEVVAATQAKADAQGFASAAADSATQASLSVDAANGVLSDTREELDAFILRYGTADELDTAIQETYANRAIINTMISTNMIVLRA